MLIRSLRANHLKNPLGFKMDAPLLTWTLEGSAGDAPKTARVQVALSSAFDAPLVDTGAREDLSPLGFTPEMTLAPRTRYYWRVEATSEKGETAVSKTAWFETAKQDEPWQAEWIEAPFDRQIHPLFAKPFTLREAPVRARAYVTGLGVYELTVNGERVSDEVLAPFYNDYDNWIQYQTYDITPLLRAGENRFDAMLGNGWYKGRFGWVENMCELFGDRMKLLAEIRCEFADGSELVLGTDGTWLCHASPVVESSIYDGEVYDARLELAPGSLEGFVNAKASETPAGALTARLSPPVRICERRKPARLLHTPAGESVIDFGQVMTGWVEFDCDLPEGAKVYLQFGELLQHDNFYRDNLRTAKEEFTFISAGRPAHVRPHFTFYGFRFMKVEGMDADPDRFTACVIHSDLPVIGKIEPANAKVNRLSQNAFWSQIGNFLDVPTDCPQRDERMGWTGDAHVFAPTASFTMYTPAFYEKYLHDMLLEQRRLDGSVPHVVPDVLDVIARILHEPQTGFGSCAWGDAAVGIPWTVYNFFGDKALLRRQFENMRLWVDWIKKQDDEHCGAKRLWNCGFHFADWLALDNPVQGSSFGGTDPYYVASAFYYSSADIVAQAAQALGLEAEHAYYANLAQEVKTAFRREFFTETGRIAEPTQTAMLLALSTGLVPEEHRERIRRDLKEKIKARDWHMDTGFVGTYYLCRTLTENGMSDVAYTLLLNEDFPSWLYEVNMGATTIWERWNSVLPNGLVSDTGMNSMNHYAYGSVVEWMYRCMCGLNPAAPGFTRATITPHSDARLGWARCEYDSASGRYAAGWKLTDTGVEYEVSVPFGCEAEFIPEDAAQTLFVNGEAARLENGKLPLKAGTYKIEARK